MKRLRFYALAFSLLAFVSSLFFSIKPNPILQLIGMAAFASLLLLLLISGIAGLCLLRREKLRAFIPVAICFVGLLMSFTVAIFLGGAIRNWTFQRNLPRYTEVVQLIEKGEIKKESQRTSVVSLPSQYADLSQITFVGTNSEGAVTVVFIIGGGFPVKHSGYLYVSTGKIEGDVETLRAWPHHSRINDKWFRISD